MIRVLIVDDHAIVREGLTQLLGTAGDIELVGAARNGVEAVDVVRRERPDVVLMDLSMPETDGIVATRQVLDAAPETHVLVLTSFSEHSMIMDALEAGAEGYLLKHAESEEILSGIREVVTGGSPLDPKAARVLLTSRRGPSGTNELTDREREVLGLVARGMSNRLIARRLGISERTVKAHLTSVFQRIGVTDRTQAALWAQRNLDS